MIDKKLPLLNIKDIEWDKDHDNPGSLPRHLELRWDKKNWSVDDVSNWLSIKFDWVFDSLKIIQIGTWEDTGGCCCAGGCDCC